MSAPFKVSPSLDFPGKWCLYMRQPALFKGWFDTQAEAINHAYRNWPWWP